ncbi:hypothetical protein ACFXJ5_38840 [Streptomyces sp. NPDC059373]
MLTTMASCDAGGAGSVDTNGPLERGTTRNTLCMSTTTGSTVTFAGEVLRNTGKGDVVIDDVKLVSAQGLRLTHSLLVPADGNLIGFDTHYPPAKENLNQSGLKWPQRRSAIHATIHPQKGSVVQNLVAAINVAGTSSPKMSGIAVDYHAGSHAYRWLNTIKLIVRIKPEKC